MLLNSSSFLPKEILFISQLYLSFPHPPSVRAFIYFSKTLGFQPSDFEVNFNKCKFRERERQTVASDLAQDELTKYNTTS